MELLHSAGVRTVRLATIVFPETLCHTIILSELTVLQLLRHPRNVLSLPIRSPPKLLLPAHISHVLGVHAHRFGRLPQSSLFPWLLLSCDEDITAALLRWNVVCDFQLSLTCFLSCGVHVRSQGNDLTALSSWPVLPRRHSCGRAALSFQSVL